RSNEQDDSEHEYDEDVCDEYGRLLEDHYKGTHLGSDSVERSLCDDFEKLLEVHERSLYPSVLKSKTLLAFVIEMLQVKVNEWLE
ncbi:hypothetical protein Dimus_006098, partial [Dionaea muscipula]